MRILAIESSCDESGVAIVEVENGNLRVLANELSSQADMHAEYGGVYPSLAKREHAKNFVPLLLGALKEADVLTRPQTPAVSQERIGAIKDILEREPELFVQLTMLLAQMEKPRIDRIAVTSGPGLAPALWVGVNLARALSIAWDIPVIPINHMEGHFVSSLFAKQDEKAESFRLAEVDSPILALLVSGGHTELVLSEKTGTYKVLGSTRDDAAGEAFDKTARLLGLPYPGGPEISKLAQFARDENLEQPFSLPRPMIDSPGFDFSFSGLKTAALRLTQEIGELNDVQKKQLAREIEDAIIEVLSRKTQRALEEHGARTLIVSGGVSANTTLRDRFGALSDELGVALRLPEKSLSTDNALMIAMAALLKSDKDIARDLEKLAADANASLHSS